MSSSGAEMSIIMDLQDFDVYRSWNSELVSEINGIETKEEIAQGPSKYDNCFHCCGIA